MRFGLIFSLLLAILAVIFALQNPQPMDVNLLVFQTQGSTALVLILTLGLGVLVGILSMLPKQLRTRKELKKLRNEQKAGSSSDASADAPNSSSRPFPAGGEGDSS